MNSLPKYFLAIGLSFYLFLLYGYTDKTKATLTNKKNQETISIKNNKEQDLLEIIHQYLTNDSLDEKHLEELGNYPEEEIEYLITSGQLKTYILQQSKDTTTNIIHGNIAITEKKDTTQDKEYSYVGIVPTNYTADKKHALIIHLHGMGRKGENYIDKWQKTFEETKTTNYILICPTFPASNWSSETGEKIVFNVIKKIKNIYNIDDDRVFLTGMSMGGGGTYNISKFHSDAFAGIAPISGATDFENKGLLLENFLHLPIYIIHGSKDNMVPVEYGRESSQKLNKLGCDVTYIEHDKIYEKMPSIGGHFYPVELLPDLVKWFDTKERKPLPSNLFIYQTKKNHDRLYWISATELEKDTVSIYGVIKDNRVEIRTEGVQTIKLFLNKNLIDFSKPVVIVVNKKERFKEVLTPNVKTLLRNYKKDRDNKMLFTAEVELKL